jgi:flagellar operon protein
MVDELGGANATAAGAGPRSRGVNAAGSTRPVQPGQPGAARWRTPGRLGAAAPASGASFDNVLQQQLAGVGPIPVPSGVRFSAHAQQRLQRREIKLGPEALAKLEGAVQRADQKGGRESLILLDDLAFVVSIKNRTVITAVDADHMKENVFTNIDSVVIA